MEVEYQYINTIDMEIDKKEEDSMDANCDQLSDLRLPTIQNELFQFLFKWNPNIAINHSAGMLSIWFNSKYYSSFQNAIQTFNQMHPTYNVLYQYLPQSSFYDSYIQIQITRKPIPRVPTSQ